MSTIAEIEEQATELLGAAISARSIPDAEDAASRIGRAFGLIAAGQPLNDELGHALSHAAGQIGRALAVRGVGEGMSEQEIAPFATAAVRAFMTTLRPLIMHDGGRA